MIPEIRKIHVGDVGHVEIKVSIDVSGIRHYQKTNHYSAYPLCLRELILNNLHEGMPSDILTENEQIVGIEIYGNRNPGVSWAIACDFERNHTQYIFHSNKIQIPITEKSFISLMKYAESHEGISAIVVPNGV